MRRLERRCDGNDGRREKHKLIEKVVSAFLESSYASHFINSSSAVVILSANTTVNSSNTQ